MLVDRREALTRRRVATVDRLQALLAELVPGEAKKDTATGQASIADRVVLLVDSSKFLASDAVHLCAWADISA